MKKITANDLTFLTATNGQGPKLLFITGTAGDLRNENSPLTSSLTEHFEVLTYDQRGMGQSSKPDQPYTMRDYAEDAIAIMNAYGWDDVFLAGYSFGGMVAQEIAIGWPTRVKRLALLATAAGGEGGSSYPLETLFDLPDEERARRSLEVLDLRFTPEWQADNPEATKQIIAATIASYNLYSHEPDATMGARRQLEARALHNTYDRLDQIACPTLVMAGTYDGQAPMAAQKAMAQAISDCQFEVVEGSHGMLWESEVVFSRLIRFMQG